MDYLRPADLAREHGISTQAVRNYERDGFLPPADRTPSGYRTYTATHAVALRAYLALVRAHGYAIGGQIMRAVNAGELDSALTAIDHGHAQLLRDRHTLDAVAEAVGHLTATAPAAPAPVPAGTQPLSVGELARRLDVTPATLRNWERMGILVPPRERITAYRVYGAADIRDAELAHLLRRGGYPLERIAAVVRQVRSAGGTEELSSALDDWRRNLTLRGLAMLEAASRLAAYTALTGRGTPAAGPAGPVETSPSD